jgi:hypothetical protein
MAAPTEEEKGGGCCARWLRREVLLALALGQIVSLLITSTGFSSSELARRGAFIRLILLLSFLPRASPCMPGDGRAAVGRVTAYGRRVLGIVLFVFYVCNCSLIKIMPLLVFLLDDDKSPCNCFFPSLLSNYGDLRKDCFFLTI